MDKWKHLIARGVDFGTQIARFAPAAIFRPFAHVQVHSAISARPIGGKVDFVTVHRNTRMAGVTVVLVERQLRRRAPICFSFALGRVNFQPRDPLSIFGFFAIFFAVIARKEDIFGCFVERQRTLVEGTDERIGKRRGLAQLPVVIAAR